MDFSPKVNLEAFLCLDIENEENWRIYFVSQFYFVWINKLAFLKEDKLPYFLRLEWMYAKFKIEV